MAKAKGTKTSPLPFTLYAVRRPEENKHANATFLHCTNGFTFCVTGDGYCERGELLLAEWQDDGSLKGLSKATVSSSSVTAVRCIKAAGGRFTVPMARVEDLR